MREARISYRCYAFPTNLTFLWIERERKAHTRARARARLQTTEDINRSPVLAILLVSLSIEKIVGQEFSTCARLRKPRPVGFVTPVAFDRSSAIRIFPGGIEERAR